LEIPFGNQTWLSGKSTPNGCLNQENIGVWLGMLGMLGSLTVLVVISFQKWDFLLKVDQKGVI